mmetsp:Transcript_11603/g.15785  ORF Transcript_11603/g.15785 Transcript_11603/m.15785 type:complete len:307 (-) Transcript_11603:139-1059(-)
MIFGDKTAFSFSYFSFLLLILFEKCEAGELFAVKDAIFATKARDVVALGLFESRTDQRFKDFNFVSKKFPEDAVGFEYSFSDEIHERYQLEIKIKGGLPTIIVFRPFDEDGISKKGKRIKNILGPANSDGFTRDSIMKFVFQSALPPVCEMPSESNDVNYRTQLALNSAYPKMFLFSRYDKIEEDSTFLDVAKSTHNRSVAIRMTVDMDDDEDSQVKDYMQSVFLPDRPVSPLKTLRHSTSILVVLDPLSGQRDELENPGEGMEDFASEFFDSVMPRLPFESSSKKTKKSNKKSKKKKKTKISEEL